MVERTMLLSADNQDKLRFLVRIASFDGWKTKGKEAVKEAA